MFHQLTTITEDKVIRKFPRRPLNFPLALCKALANQQESVQGIGQPTRVVRAKERIPTFKRAMLENFPDGGIIAKETTSAFQRTWKLNPKSIGKLSIFRFELFSLNFCEFAGRVFTWRTSFDQLYSTSQNYRLVQLLLPQL